MIDNYSHNDPHIMYVTENIPGPVEDSLEYNVLIGNYNSQILHGCLCSKMCMTMSCKCLKVSHGENYEVYLQNGILKYKLKHFGNYPIIECNDNCTCTAHCGNRVVQKGPMEGLLVKLCQNKEKGLGLFSTVFVPAGSFICEYAGELLTKTQALSRSKENDEINKMNYVFCLNEHTHEGIIQTFVDPSMFGNIGRYINHRCEPSCEVVPVRYENAIPHLAIFAVKDILPGTEITFCYGVGSEHMRGESKSALTQKPCLCNAESCMQFMPFDNF